MFRIPWHFDIKQAFTVLSSTSFVCQWHDSLVFLVIFFPKYVLILFLHLLCDSGDCPFSSDILSSRFSSFLLTRCMAQFAFLFASRYCSLLPLLCHSFQIFSSFFLFLLPCFLSGGRFLVLPHTFSAEISRLNYKGNHEYSTDDDCIWRCQNIIYTRFAALALAWFSYV